MLSDKEVVDLKMKSVVGLVETEREVVVISQEDVVSHLSYQHSSS